MVILTSCNVGHILDLCWCMNCQVGCIVGFQMWWILRFRGVGFWGEAYWHNRSFVLELSSSQWLYGWFHLEITWSTSCVGIVQNPLTSKNEILSGILAYPNKTSATTQKFVPTTMRLQRRFDRLSILISGTFLNSRLIHQVGNAPEFKGPAYRP
jgi:hypothetical protein